MNNQSTHSPPKHRRHTRTELVCSDVDNQPVTFQPGVAFDLVAAAGNILDILDALPVIPAKAGIQCF